MTDQRLASNNTTKAEKSQHIISFVIMLTH